MHFLRKNSHWLIVALGTITWSLTMIKSGLIYEYGMGFWGPNGHDGIWHISLIESLSRGSLQMPIFAGEQIKNYHLGFDLLVAGIHFLTQIPVVTLYFQIIPPILAFLIGTLVYKLTKNNWSTFFVYFGGSLSWILGKGESTFWSQQPISTLINPPFALSLILLLILLLLLQKQRYFSAGLILAILPHVKIYAGILAFIGLFFLTIKNRKIFLTLLLGLIIYVPSNYTLFTNHYSLVVWRPGWFLETIMSPDRLNWPRYYSALTTYGQTVLTPKAVVAYLVAFAFFIIGNMGTRLIFLRRQNNLLFSFSFPIIIVGSLIPMFFLQRGTAWNTIQFFYYSLFFTALISNFKPKLLLGTVLVLLTIPTTLDTLKNVYLPSRPPAMVSTEELEALGFLSLQGPGTVLTFPAIPDPYVPAPRPLYLYDSTAYVSALSGQKTFLEDEVNLNITGYDWQSRHRQVVNFFVTPDSSFLKNHNIRYIFSLTDQSFPGNKVFSNSHVAIWNLQ